jgi:RHS repeat-associated protein
MQQHFTYFRLRANINGERHFQFQFLTVAFVACYILCGTTRAADGNATKAIGVGPYDYVAIKGDGTGVGWGYNFSGEAGYWTNYGVTFFSSYVQYMWNLSNVVAVAAGGKHTTFTPDVHPAHLLALLNDGRLMASGDNAHGQLGRGPTTDGSKKPVFVTNLADVVAVSAGGWHSLALTGDGNVWSWGSNDKGQLGIGDRSISQKLVPVTVTNLSNVVFISAGRDFTLAATSDGKVYAWGANNLGQLGDNTVINKYAPTNVLYLSNIIAVAAGGGHSLALRFDGSVWTWGDNSQGQLAITNTSVNFKRPTLVNGISNIVAISAGAVHSLALQSDGTVWAWGHNRYGQIGGNTNIVVNPRPTIVKNISGVVSLTAGGFSSMAQLANGAVATWGSQGHQRLINPSALTGLAFLQGLYHDSNPSPVNLQLSTDAVNLSAIGDGFFSITLTNNPPLEFLSNHKSVLVRADGTVWSCGFNGFGVLGTATETSRNRLVQIQGLTEILATSTGGGHSLAVRRDGSVWTWGGNVFGQLGDGTVVPRLAPGKLSISSGLTIVSAGGQHSLAIDTNATVWAWGCNFYGQLGDDTVSNRVVPIHLSSLTGITNISTGNQHSLALDNLGRVWAWGDNRYGQIGDGTFSRRLVPTNVLASPTACSAIAAGDHHSLGLTASGNVYAWGDNNSGQIGNNTQQNQSSPVQVLTGIKAIGAGSQFSVALSTNGTVWTWGLNSSGQLGDGTTTTRLTPVQVYGLSGVVAIRVFSDHVVAIMADTSVRVWGANRFGQLGNGNNDDQTVPVTVPGFYISDPTFLSYSLNALATNTARYVRGNGNDSTYKSFVIPLDFEKGVKLDDLGDNTNKFGGSRPWFTRIPKDTRHHIGLLSLVTTNADGSQVGTYGWTNDFENPIVAFGSSAGGTPLNIDRKYQFGVYAGAQFENTNVIGVPFISPIRVLVYRKADFVAGQTNLITPFATNYVTIPRRTVANDQSAWMQFLTNGLTVTLVTNGLETTLQLVEDVPLWPLTNFANTLSTSPITVTNPGPSGTWSQSPAGNQAGLITTNVLETDTATSTRPSKGAWEVTHSFTNARSGPYVLTHKALSSDYCYVIEALGVLPSSTNVAAAVLNNTRTDSDWCRLYSVDFDNPQPWRSVFVRSPQFNGQPIPPDYIGKSPLELTNLHAVVTNVVTNLTAAIFTNLDQSPELRRHPILDNFVRDLAYDPISIANYVQNEIELTDALSYNENSGQASAPTITQDGVSRGALGVFTEGQGSPIEQCALLIYLLRAAGYSAAYVFPTNNNIQMLDNRLSSLLRMQIHGAVDPSGNQYTSNTLITVNYPWVVTQIGTNCIHLFPWLKDTEMIEGLDLYDYLPDDYNSGAKWLRQYLFADQRILSLDSHTDVPSVLFPKFVVSSLLQNHPGTSLDDIGMRIRNRRHLYSRWQEFPVPNVVNTPTQAVISDSLSGSALTNALPQMTNVFNTVQVQIFNLSYPTNVDTGELRMADLHNRRFLIMTNGNNLQLWLAAYQAGITNQTLFGADTTLTNVQYLNFPLTNGPLFGITVTHRRHKAINPSAVPVTNNYLGVFEQLVTSQSDRFIQTNEIIALCLSAGQVTAKMLDVHAQAYWRMRQQMQTNSLYKPPLQDAQGTAVYLMGMDYFRNVSRFRAINERLHKAHVISWYSEGLCSLTFETKGGKKMTRPTLDVYLNEIAYAGNGTARPDNGDTFLHGLDDFLMILLNEMGAQEHNLLASYYASTNAISAVKLLQIAQQRSSPSTNGILELTKNNYAFLGDSPCLGYGATLLKNYDTNLWRKVTNSFSGWDNDYVRVYITPSRIYSPNKYFTKMAAVILGRGRSSFIATGDLNQGETSGEEYFFDDTTIPDLGEGSSDTDASDSISGIQINIGLGTYGTPNTGLAGSGYDPAFFTSGSFAAQGNSFLQLYNDTASTFGFQPYSWDTTGISGKSIMSWNFSLLNPFLLNLGTPPPRTPAQDTFEDGFRFTYGQPNQDPVAAQTLTTDIGNSGNLNFRQRAGLVSDPVDPVSGAFRVDTVDLQLPGPFPLAIRRNYSSQNFSDKNNFGYGWRINYVPYLMVTTNKVGTISTLILHAAEEDGSVVVYRQQTNNLDLFIPLPTDNPALNNNTPQGIGSVFNMFNARIIRSQSGTNTFYTLTSPDGSSRVFRVMPFPLIGTTKNVDRSRPYLITWQDSRGNSRAFSYGTNSASPDWGQLIRIQCSNGNFVGFYYNTDGYITQAYTGDGRRIRYDYDGFGDLVTVTRPDTSDLHYEYNHYLFVKNNALHNDSDHSLVREIKPEGRVLQNIYDSERRVVVQLSTVGADLDLYTNAVFTYSNNFAFTTGGTNFITGYTLIADVNQQTTRYDYTSNLIMQITDPLAQAVIQNWFFTTNSSGGYQKSLQSIIDKRGLTNSFLYDTNGNVTSRLVTGADLTGDGQTNALFTYTYTSNSILASETDSLSNVTKYAYGNSSYRFLPTSIEKYASNNVPVSTNTFIYTNFFTVVTNGPLVLTNGAYGMPTRLIKADHSTDAATNDSFFDGRGWLTSQVSYSSSPTIPNLTNTYFYNTRGELVQQTDAIGRMKVYAYDDLGNPTGKEIYESAAPAPLSTEYFYYNGNGELTWYDGPRYEPEDYVWRDYDGAGRKTEEIHWRSRAKADGSGVEAETGDNLFATTFYEYDELGNQTAIKDQYGDVTRMAYDAIGQLIDRRSYGPNSIIPLSIEHFTYEPGGQISTHTNALGGVTLKSYTTTGHLKRQVNPDGSILLWTYDLLGRTRRQYLVNGSFWATSYDDANRMVIKTNSTDPSYKETTVLDRRGNTIIVTNAVGAVFTTSYDGLDRVMQKIGPGSAGHQQIATYTYDSSGRQLIITNALGEFTITTFDALGRTVTNAIYGAGGTAPVSITSTIYGTNRQGITTITGTGSGAIATTAFTDTYGKPILTQKFPTAGATNFSINTYDILENLTISRDELGQSTTNLYDSLNRLQTQILPGGAVINFTYNSAGSMTSRIMPGGLTWLATYDAADRITREQLVGGSLTNRFFTYQYYGTNSPHVGLLQTRTDIYRRVTNNLSYDGYLRLATNSATGLLPDQNLFCAYQYDLRGLATNIVQAGTTTNQVLRTFDAYGQITREQVWLSGAVQSDFSQTWNVAARRVQLAQAGAGSAGTITFSNRADNVLTNIYQGGQNFRFNYGDSGLLVSRSNPWRILTIGQRDGQGRILSETNLVGSATASVETLAWRANSTLASYAATRSGTGAWNDSRAYQYDTRNRVTAEPIGVTSTALATNNYTFDTGGLGMLLQAQWTGNLTNLWHETATNGLAQITSESWNQSNLTLRANGSAVNASSVTATLDTTPVSGVSVANGRWTADLLGVPPGTHTVAATASYTVGQFSSTASSTFNVANANSVTNYYDGTGNVTNRLFASGKSQALIWDGFGRLTGVIQRDSSNNGFNWSAIYDCFGRRLRTINTPVVANQLNLALTLTIDSLYDPEVEFQELAVALNGSRTWKVLGPDLNGRYGGLQGLGGLEATIQESGVTNPVLNDAFGNVLSTINPQTLTVNWSPVRLTGYGPALGYQAPILSLNTSLADTLVWRNRRLDPSGFFYLGARYYDPLCCRFLSPDPLGHAISMSLYDFCDGDAVNSFDSDGRCLGKNENLPPPLELGTAPVMRSETYARYYFNDGTSTVPMPLSSEERPWSMLVDPDAVSGMNYWRVTKPTDQWFSYVRDTRDPSPLNNPSYGATTWMPITKPEVEMQQQMQFLIMLPLVAISVEAPAMLLERAELGLIVAADPNPIIGDILAGNHPDSMIHLSVSSAGELSTGVFREQSWVRLGDVSHMTIPEFQELVVGPNAAAYGPNITGFAVSKPGAAVFQPSVWSYSADVIEFRNPNLVVPDAFVPLK